MNHPDGYIEFTAENMPYHLRDAATGTKCSRCGRTSWAEEEFNQVCRMPQPNGSRCPGVFGYPQDFD